jgi:HlyD family secretion protein
VIIGSLLALNFFGALGNREESSAAAQAQGEGVAVVFLGDLAASTTATGNIEAQREASLSLQVAGTVERVLVSEGDQVNAGDVLVQLQTSDLARAVANGEQNLIIQEANLAELLDSASDADMASAQAALESAQANLADVVDGADQADIDAARASLSATQEAYQDLLAGPDANDIAQAKANLRNAEATLRQAQSDYDEVAWRSDIGQLPQALELEQATNSYEVALANYNSTVEGASADELEQARANVVQAQATLEKVLDSPTPAELAAAESQVTQAETTLSNLLDGASDEQIAIAQAQVEQARIDLAEVRENYADATLLAPFDGTVTAVHVAEGELANGVVVELADSTNLQIVLDVDEVDIGDLRLGQPAVITLETWPDTEILGEITAIAPRATAGSSAIVSYEVHLSLEETDLPLLIGMTADAELITAAREDVLLVPNQAITPDREANTYSVNRLVPGTNGASSSEQIEVTTGLKNDEFTEILSGLGAGDQVLLNTISTSSDEAEETRGFLVPPAPGGNGGAGGGFARPGR